MWTNLLFELVSSMDVCVGGSWFFGLHGARCSHTSSVLVMRGELVLLHVWSCVCFSHHSLGMVGRDGIGERRTCRASPSLDGCGHCNAALVCSRPDSQRRPGCRDAENRFPAIWLASSQTRSLTDVAARGGHGLNHTALPLMGGAQYVRSIDATCECQYESLLNSSFYIGHPNQPLYMSNSLMPAPDSSVARLPTPAAPPVIRGLLPLPSPAAPRLVAPLRFPAARRTASDRRCRSAA